MNSWSPSDTPITSLEPCGTSCFDVTPLGGLRSTVLLDLIYLMGLLEEQGWLATHQDHKMKCSQEKMKESEMQHCFDEDGKEKSTEANSFLSPSSTREARKTVDHQELTCPTQPPQTSHSSKLDAFGLELRTVRVSYLLIGALKSLTHIFSCENPADLLQMPKNDPSGNDNPSDTTTPLSSPNSDQTNSRSRQWDESAELRSVLQYVVQSMVKWAVRPCPIKQSVSLADLERAQIMIYKGAISKLQEDKEHKGIYSVDLVFFMKKRFRFLPFHVSLCFALFSIKNHIFTTVT